MLFEWRGRRFGIASGVNIQNSLRKRWVVDSIKALVDTVLLLARRFREIFKRDCRLPDMP
jgi:hypothetical protein